MNTIQQKLIQHKAIQGRMVELAKKFWRVNRKCGKRDS